MTPHAASSLNLTSLAPVYASSSFLFFLFSLQPFLGLGIFSFEVQYFLHMLLPIGYLKQEICQQVMVFQSFLLFLALEASQQTQSNKVVDHCLVQNLTSNEILKAMPRHFQFWALLKAHLDCYLIAVSVNEQTKAQQVTTIFTVQPW